MNASIAEEPGKFTKVIARPIEWEWCCPNCEYSETFYSDYDESGADILAEVHRYVRCNGCYTLLEINMPEQAP